MAAKRERVHGVENTLHALVEARRERGLLRGLQRSSVAIVVGDGSGGVASTADLCSNDYLGLAREQELLTRVEREFARVVAVGEVVAPLGSTGSRLLTGNSGVAERLESAMAVFHEQESALLFNSGFDLNLGLFGSVPQVEDVVVFDELVHNSVREGLRLSRGSSEAFKHNDVVDLRRALTEARAKGKKNLIISIESVYSMDGHLAPLKEICDVADEFDASVVVDEAHGTGVYGKGGRGLVHALGLTKRVYCVVHTFGKAMGVHGACVVGSRVLCDYLLNYARPLIFSTSLPLHSLISIQESYSYMEQVADERQAHLQKIIAHFTSQMKSKLASHSHAFLVSESPIQGIIIPGAAEVVEFSRLLKEKHGFHVLPIRSPTVPKGTERLRIILHYHNTFEEVDRFVDALKSLLKIT